MRRRPCAERPLPRAASAARARPARRAPAGARRRRRRARACSRARPARRRRSAPSGLISTSSASLAGIDADRAWPGRRRAPADRSPSGASRGAIARRRDAVADVDRDAQQGLRRARRELLDLHAALAPRPGAAAPGSPASVSTAAYSSRCDLDPALDQQALDPLAADRHAEDRPRGRLAPRPASSPAGCRPPCRAGRRRPAP